MKRARDRWIVAAALAAVLAASAADLHAQRRAPATATFGLSILAADPVGNMGAIVDNGFGGQMYATYPLEKAGHVRIRGDLGLMVYGHERSRLCFGTPIGCRIEMDLTTTNSIAFGGIGPEIVLSTGRVQPYLNGSVGVSYFSTTSALSGSADYDDFANTTNFDDAVMAWRAGAGLRVQVAGGRKPVWLDMAVERHENGVAEYLTKGDILDNPDGSVTLFPTRSDANLMTLRFGVTIGIPRGRGRR